MMKRIFFVLSTLAVSTLATGCWTFNESEYPEVAIMRSPKTDKGAISVGVSGFEATVVEYSTMHGYSTVYSSGFFGRHHYHPGGFDVVSTTATIASDRKTDMFLKRAREKLEDAGYIIAANTPDWTIEVNFSGPFVTSADRTESALWMIGSVFFLDYSTEEWTAKLRLRDNRTGELVFHREYAQRYETNVFGLIPIFGIAGCDKTSGNYMLVWCLSALTDRAIADATAFLTSGK